MSVGIPQQFQDAVDTCTGMTAVGVQSKGSTGTNAVEPMTAVAQYFGHHTITLRSDEARAIVTFLDTLRDRMGRHEATNKVLIRSAPGHA